MTNEHDTSKHGRDASMHEHDASNEAEITLHEKLCAYILGEANDDERAEVERALSTSADLRAERERLELTIGFVRDAMTDVEKLSPEATADVLTAASAKKPRPWYFSMPMRIAAGIAAVTLLYAITQQRGAPSLDKRIARVEDSREAGAMRKPADSDMESSRGPVVAEANVPASSAHIGERADEAKKEAVVVAQAAPGERAREVMNEVSGNPEALIDTDPSHYVPLREQPRDSLAKDERAAGLVNSRLDQSSVNGTHSFEADSGGAASIDHKESRESAPSAAPPAGGAATGAAGDGHYSTGSSAFGGRKLGSARVQPTSPLPANSLAAAKSGSAGASQPAARVGSTDAVTSLDAFANLKGLGYTSEGGAAAKDDTSAERKRLYRLGYVDGSDDASAIKELQDKLKQYRPEHSRYKELLNELKQLEARQNLTPEQREAILDQQCRLILEHCRRQPNERPRDMYFRFWGDNAFQIAALEAQSTFSADVDTASYALARRYLNEGQMPEKAQVRTEEFINYFKPDAAAPREGTFAIQTELAPSRFSNDAGRTMLRVTVRGREVTRQERKPLALTFVIDCSGSMIEQGRLEMVKHAIRLLLSQLDANDTIAIVAFSSDARMILPMTSAKQKDLIESALFPLKPENSTNSEAGLRMGYEAALSGINPNANNRVIFLSDGVANVGETNPEKLAEGVKRIREKGIYLNSIGVGMNNHNDVLLEQLADKGDGVCNYIDSPDEAQRVMVDNFTGAMETIARDVKIQVEFDPAQVYRYRLLGYENRFVANKDFRNDKIDAGEVGAGHQVCALYELELANSPARAAAPAGTASGDAAPKPLATVRLRWKAPRDVRHPDANEEASEIERPVLASQMTSYEGASFGYKRAVLVAQFAEFLRRSTHARGRSFDDLVAEAKKLEKQAEDKDFGELVTLLDKSRSLILANLPQCDELCQTIDVVRRNQILRAEHDLLSTERDQKALDDLAKQNAELEAPIRELLRRKLEEKAK